jgi:DnaJ-domain-containing protein 1
MMRYEPTLIVTRVVIERGDLAVYDEVFHEGVNIIRGENSSGKSTVLNFIFYGLGGDLTDWSSVARLCSRVLIEVRINGNVATLRRDVSDKTGQPMEIFGGHIELSRKAPRSEWIRYPYRGSEGSESFSQALFRLLKIPEVNSDLSGNITMNQVLRLLYADQLSPIEDIFRFQRFDDATLRDTVGRLLCGAYDSALYDNDQKIRALTREADSITGELKSLFAILGKAEHGLTIDWIEGQRRVLEEKRLELQAATEEAERAVFTASAEDQLTMKAQDEVYSAVQQLQIDLVTAHHARDALMLSIADSAAFINSLQSKIEALSDSSSVAEHIGNINFHSCPACYAPIDDAPSHACHLCKTPFDSDRTRTRIVGLINDTALQIKQSQFLQVKRERRLSELNEHIQDLESRWNQASHRLAILQRLPSTASRERLRDLHRQFGYLERQIEDLEQKAHLVQLIREKSERKDTLNAEIIRLRSTNDALRAQQKGRLTRAYTIISEEIKELLSNDLRRQDIFEDPKLVSFTFAENKIAVDGENYFSASSRAILKSSFCLGFLAAATKAQFFRHPRFCMLDSLENMGVEMIRSHNFQLQIARVSSESQVEHQIIYATAMIEPSLDDETYTIGRYSTRDQPTIAIRL